MKHRKKKKQKLRLEMQFFGEVRNGDAVYAMSLHCEHDHLFTRAKFIKNASFPIDKIEQKAFIWSIGILRSMNLKGINVIIIETNTETLKKMLYNKYYKVKQETGCKAFFRVAKLHKRTRWALQEAFKQEGNVVAEPFS